MSPKITWNENYIDIVIHWHYTFMSSVWILRLEEDRRSLFATQGRRKVWKFVGEGISSNVVGIIWPKVEIGLTDLPKSGGPPWPLSAPTALWTCKAWPRSGLYTWKLHLTFKTLKEYRTPLSSFFFSFFLSKKLRNSSFFLSLILRSSQTTIS